MTIDEQVAEKVMGWRLTERSMMLGSDIWYSDRDGWTVGFNPTTDDTDMCKVLDRLEDRFEQVSVVYKDSLYVLECNGDFTQIADTRNMAVCKGALLAYGAGIWPCNNCGEPTTRSCGFCHMCTNPIVPGDKVM